ncbi:uncharacterized protein LOC132029486 [Lycium ferocissimum]|uniref:uncharacterized protein LOC132029486 n=1 Tax=Lycium ferocissimum TaxID=112874 RepID=UPI0028158C17|nr:uncharacterized protein LOC132029486 [Lycium ferocissimum]
MEALNHFSYVTGLSANSEKSSLYMAVMDDDAKANLLSKTGFSEGRFPMKYLGLPLSPKKWSKLDCHQLRVKVTEKIRAVSSRHLSYVGKLQVINAILFSLHNFWGAMFILPESILKDVDKKCREFLRGSNEETKKVSLVAWEKLCKPKKEGGLNIRSCRKWNLALVGKLIWMLITNKEVLWVRWVHGIYMKPDEEFWSHVPSGNCSWYWRNIHKVKLGMQQWYSTDRYVLTTSGVYSVSQSYLSLIEHREIKDCHELIWSKMLSPKHRFILWLAAQNRLLTKDRMLGMGIECEIADCVLCDKEELENPQHLFVECVWSQAVWNELMQWLGLAVPQQDLKRPLRWVKKKKWCRMMKEVLVAVHGAVIYFTWQARNGRIFRKRNESPSVTVQQIKFIVKERIGMFIGSK